MTVVNIGEAKTNLSRLIRLVEQGEDVVIARDGKPVVKLVGLPAERKPRVPGRDRGRFVVPDDFKAPLPPEIQRSFDGEGD